MGRKPQERQVSPGMAEVVGFFSIRPLVGPEGRREVPVDDEATVGVVVNGLGIHPELLGLMLLNGCGAQVDSRIKAGDRLALYPDYVPYHKIYGTCIV